MAEREIAGQNLQRTKDKPALTCVPPSQLVCPGIGSLNCLPIRLSHASKETPLCAGGASAGGASVVTGSDAEAAGLAYRVTEDAKCRERQRL